MQVSAICYLRTSTDNQKEEKTIQIQEVALMEFAKSNGYEIVALFKDDGVSGGLEDRPALAELISFLENPENKNVSTVLVYSLSRLARDLYIQEHLIRQFEKMDKKLISTVERDLESENPMRKAFRQFCGIVSELEKAYITMRLAAGRINKIKKSGFPGGRVAFGFSSKDKDILINVTNSELVKRIYKMKRYHHLSVRDIAAKLNAEAIPTISGGNTWQPSSVWYILKNPVYRGKLHYKAETAFRTDLAII